MDLGKAGWLDALIDAAVLEHRPQQALASLRDGDKLPSGRARARAYLRRMLRASGLVYGTPQSSGTAEAPSAPEEQLFWAGMRTFARMALDIAVLIGAPPGPRREQLWLLFAALSGLLDEADDIRRRLEKPGAAVPVRLRRKVESTLAELAVSLAGDPAYGLVLHNGAVYADAQMFCRQAIDYFARGYLPLVAAQRRIDFAARQKALLVEVLTALACAERTPSFPARRAILRQIEDLKLPSKQESELRSRVKRAFEHRPSLRTVVKEVRSRELRRFIIEQTLLASLVDGKRSPEELAFIRELAGILRFSADDLRKVELEVAEFYARNRSVVDVFTVASGAEVMGEEVVAGIQRTLEKNFTALMKEVRETGELSVLLAKAARGQDLTRDERRRMRQQLIDVAKAIPALAMFAAPGGLLLFIALAKVLPFNILPSAFQDEPPDQPGSTADSQKAS
jgi:hypothetical protein